MQTRTIMSSIPLPLAERLDTLVEHLDLSYDQIIAEAISAWIDREDERRIIGLRVIAANNSMFVEGNRIIDWADSL